LVRIVPAMSPTDSMNQQELKAFLTNTKSPLKLATIDRHGDPVIHPLWYHYDDGRFYLITASNSKKLENAKRQSRVYFCVDTETRPYKGAKGKGTTMIVTDSEKAVRMAEMIITKYMRSLENSLGKFLLGRLRTGQESVVEITQSYYSVWDDSKSP
jgi:nitroimidazol reductase NimA-like FMN-containing flavoprotein (pyridoxamine 5'-phosphate oxidase superfamily)